MNLLFFFYPLYVCLLPLRDVLGGAAAVAKGKRRTGEEPVDKATLQKHRHMIKSLLLGPENANRRVSNLVNS
ncbi:hypothetical protein HN873_036170 [Arachis hypogaea]